MLVFDAVVRDLALDEPDVVVEEPALVEEPVEPVDEVVAGEPFAPPVLETLALLEEQIIRLPGYAVSGDDDGHRDAAVDESDVAGGQTPVVEEPAELSADVVPDDEPLTPPALRALAPPEEQSYQLPDHAVERPEAVGDTVDELPDYVVKPADEPAPFMPEYIAAPAELLPVDETVADVAGEVVVFPEVVELSEDHEAKTTDYPVLPDLEERSDALEETEAALRRIREQLVPPAQPKRRRRLRRRFTIFAGLCAMTAAGVAVADVQLGVTHAWLGF